MRRIPRQCTGFTSGDIKKMTFNLCWRRRHVRARGNIKQSPNYFPVSSPICSRPATRDSHKKSSERAPLSLSPRPPTERTYRINPCRSNPGALSVDPPSWQPAAFPLTAAPHSASRPLLTGGMPALHIQTDLPTRV